MPTEKLMLHCYNLGCGQLYDPNENTEDSCRFHSGQPFFHDAYKGWSCCNKKCTDFTEFLNIKGCQQSYHSNIKPPEPERPPVDKSKVDEVIEVRAPVVKAMERPPFDTPLTELKPDVSASLKQQLEAVQKSSKVVPDDESAEGVIPVGTSCKNGGCKATYESLHSLDDSCTHHPGYPVFHEGMKFWTCCTKRTSDFNAFLDQVGCTVGRHVWFKKETGKSGVRCRYDWHQTVSHVVVSVFAKKYDPAQSFVKISPVRVMIHLFFPEEDSSFDLDLELRGVIDVKASAASMLGTKLEVKLKKAEPGSWANLDFPRLTTNVPASAPSPVKSEPELENRIDAVDLSDL